MFQFSGILDTTLLVLNNCMAFYGHIGPAFFYLLKMLVIGALNYTRTHLLAFFDWHDMADVLLEEPQIINTISTCKSDVQLGPFLAIL